MSKHKKVSVTFNLTVDEGITHEQLRDLVRIQIQDHHILKPVRIGLRVSHLKTHKITSLNVNDIQAGAGK